LSTPATQLSDRELSRATLARQLLLEREARPVLDVVQHLVGLQAQVPHDPYTALWSRVTGFDPPELSSLLEDRRVVRTALLRATIHLVTADDCLLLRPLVQPILTAELQRHGEHAPKLAGVELDPVLAAGSEILAEPRTLPELKAELGRRFPRLDAAALAYACRCHLPLVQVPPRGLWRRSSQVTLAAAEAWLGRPLHAQPTIDEVMVRYLGAFGPASVADAATWSRLTGLRDVFERLRPRLVTFVDERGRELFDLPDAPRPAADVPTPVRFLPEYDNVLLSHADRSRFRIEEERALLAPGWGVGWGAVLHDGLVRARWRRRNGEVVVVHVPLPKRALASVAAEGRRLARFLGDADARLERVRP
jgi:hypothetical protein